MLGLVVLTGGLLIAAHLTLGGFLSRRIFDLRPNAPTAAADLADGADFVAAPKPIVFAQHLASIAGASILLGPAVAVIWGWLPALAWVVLGSILFGAAHDLGSLVVSLRSGGRTIGDIAGDVLGPRVRLIVLVIAGFSLCIMVSLLASLTAMVLREHPAAIAPVLVQVPLALIIGRTMRRRGRSIGIPSVIALAVMLLTLWLGASGASSAVLWLNATLAEQPLWGWLAVLLLSALAASVAPVRTLTQPRDTINGLLLATVVGMVLVGLVVAALFGGDSADAGPRPPLELVAPMVNPSPPGAPPMLPVLFITVCGVCSGFNGLVASGSTSKQLASERDARAVGVGAVLLAAFASVLVIAACAGGIGLGTSTRLEVTHQRGFSPGTEWTKLARRSFGVIGGAEQVLHYSERELAVTLSLLSVASRDDQESVRVHAARLPTPWLMTDVGTARVEADGTTSLRGRLAFANQYASWTHSSSLITSIRVLVRGSANFLAAMGIPLTVGVALVAVMVASLAVTTMHTACRALRYVLQELASTFLPKCGGCPKCGYDISGLERPATGPGADVPALDAPCPVPHASLPRCPECGWEIDRSLPTNILSARRRLASPVNPFKWLAVAHVAAAVAVVAAFLVAMGPWPSNPASRVITMPWLGGPPVPSYTNPPAPPAWFELASLQALKWLTNGGTGGIAFWPLFGATSLLLAGMVCLIIPAWLRAQRAPFRWLIPVAVVLLALSIWAIVWLAFIGNADNPSWVAQRRWAMVCIASTMLALGVWVVVEASLRMMRATPVAPIDGTRRGASTRHTP